MNEKWDWEIKPKNALFELNLGELVRYKDLLVLFIKRDIVTQYKQTVLGPLWFFIQPAMTTLMFMIVFGGIAGIPTDGVPQPLFYLAGISLWNYFSGCLTVTSNVFVANQGIFGKVYFPRLIMPLSAVCSNLLKLGIQLLLFLLVYLYFLIDGTTAAPTRWILATPFLIGLLAAQSLGFGILISSMTTKYRDLTILFTFVIQLWMYATPVIYPLSLMSPRQQAVMSLNPVTPLFEAFKYATLGVGSFTAMQLAYSILFTVLLLALGIVVFNRVQRSFMDTV